MISSIRFAGTLPQQPITFPQQRAAARQPQFGQAPVKGASVIHFGRSTAQAKNGLWITVERVPAKVGGLGEVSETIPWAVQKYGGKDMRVLMPYLAPLKKEGGFEQVYVTGKNGERKPLEKKLIGPDGKVETFTLMQRKEEDTGNWIYAVASDKYFGKYDNLYLPANRPVDEIGDDAEFKAVMMFNRVAAAFTPELNVSKKEDPTTNLAKFDGKIDFVWVHDWLTGAYLNELPNDFKKNVGLIGQLHNTFDQPRRQAAVKRSRLKVPGFLSRHDRKTGAPTGALKERYSPLSLMAKLSDAVFANFNYIRTITLTEFGQWQQSTKYLKEKLLEGRIFDIHHGLSDNYNPYINPALQTEGFTQLDQTSVNKTDEMQRFKTQNKLAMQKWLGLEQNPNAVVMNWVARFDPWQKGFYLVMNEAEKLLRQDPNLQLVIVGTNKDKDGNDIDPKIAEWIERMNATPEFKGRLHLPNKFVGRSDVVRINAGSDYTLLPSLYEPYGLTQLESMRLGSIPIVHGVDGLRSTVSDPALNGKDGGPVEKAWQYGQTGVLMEPIDIVAYRRAIGAQNRGNATPEQLAVIEQAQRKFSSAAQRALQLAKDPAKATEIRLSAMHFVDQEHRWEPIVKRYVKVIDEVVAAKRGKKPAADKPSARFA